MRVRVHVLEVMVYAGMSVCEPHLYLSSSVRGSLCIISWLLLEAFPDKHVSKSNPPERLQFTHL